MSDYLKALQEQADAVGRSGPAPTPDYMDTLRRQADEAGKMQFRGTVSQALTTNPDQYAGQRQVAQRIGVAPAVVQALPAEMETRDKLQRIESDTANSAPLRLKYSDADFAKLAHDDSGALSAVGEAVASLTKYLMGATPTGGFIGALKATPALAAEGILGAKKAMVDVVEPWARLVTQNPDNTFSTLSKYYSARSAEEKAKAEALSPADNSIIGGGLQAGFQSLGGNSKYLPLAFLPGGAPFALAGMGIETFGHSYNRAADKNIPLMARLLYAASDATIEVATETGPLGALVHGVKAGAPFVRTMLTNAIKENKGEQVATLLQDANEWAVLNPDKPFVEYLKERPAAAVQTLIATLVGVGGNTALAEGVQRASDAVAGRQRQIDLSLDQVDKLQGLFKAALDSKVRERDPVSFGNLVQQMAEATPGAPANVFIDARALTDALAANPEAAGVFNQMPAEVQAQVQEALATGGAVEIPLGDLVAKGAGTALEAALLPHIRTSLDGLSQTEAKDAAGQAATYLQQEADRVIAESDRSETIAASADAVHSQVLDQLNAINRNTPDVNGAYATLIKAFYTATSARLGMTPEEMYAKHPLSIKGETVGAVLDQPGSANFDKWFGDSKVVDAAGKPMIVYHGTDQDFSRFAKGIVDPIGFKDGQGHFFTTDPDYAQDYGNTLMPVYLNIRNPYRAPRDGYEHTYISPKRRAELAEQGYDGVIFEGNKEEMRPSEIIVFDDTQIKSAIGNSGAYDANDPSILKQAGNVAPDDSPKFTFKENKDGTLLVSGDVEQIRELLPPGVVGRQTNAGLVFSHTAAHRVRSALEGISNTYSREGKVLGKLPMKNGRYVGAPAKFDTPGKAPTLRKWLRKLALEGEPGRFWYENSSRAILHMVGGDVTEARKFVALLAIYSPQAKVDANSTFALRAWSQYKAGQPISVKTGVMDAKAKEALDNVDKFWSGEKTGNFFFNLLSEIDPSTKGKQGATIDMWMMRAGQYETDAPTATQYAFMENETNRLAAELGWEPQQVQAAIWVAMKARMENPGVKKATEAKSAKKSWIRYEYPEKNGKPQKTRVILDAQKHRDNWLEHSFNHDPSADDTQGAKFDFSDGVRRHIGQVSWEARPGRSTGVLPGVNDAPYDQQVEFQQAVQQALLGPNGEDLLAQRLGLLVDGGDLAAPGVWQGEVAAGMQKAIAMAPAKGDAGRTSIDAAQKQALDTYSAMLGLLLRQEGVGWHRPFYAGNKSGENGVELRIGKPFSPEQAKELWAAIDSRMRAAGVADWEQSAGMISSPQGMRVVNFGALEDNKAFRQLVESVAPDVSFDADPVHFTSDGNLVTNDWTEASHGQIYARQISDSGRSDLLGWGRDVLAPRVQAVFDEFSARYGWGNPGNITDVFPSTDEVPSQSGTEEQSNSDTLAQQGSGAADGELKQSAPSSIDNRSHAARVLQGAPVAVLSGNEAPATGGMKALREWATALFAADPVNGVAVNPRLGEVALDARAVRDSLGHGVNRYKAAAFAAVQQVLEHGVVIAQGVKNDVIGFYVSAPVQIGGVDDVVTVLVHREEKTQRMYLHSVTTKENLLQTQVSSSSVPPTGADGNSGPLNAGDVRRVLQDLLTLKQDPEGLSEADLAPPLLQQARGTYNPATLTISLLQTADLSTFLHEAGHFFLEVMADLASQENAPEQITADFGKILKWFGVKDAEDGTKAIDVWRAMTLDEKRPHHERWAESFEQYLIEGKAPSLELRGPFQRFRGWLTTVYKSLRDFAAGRDLKISGEIRAVMDRLVATEDQISEAEQQAKYEAVYKTAEEAGMDEHEWAVYQAMHQEGTDAAIDQMQARSISDLKWAAEARSKALRQAQRAVDSLRKAMRVTVTEAVMASPIEQARAWIKDMRQSTPEQKAALKAWTDQRAAVLAAALAQAKADLIAANPDAKGIQKGQLLAKNNKAMANQAEAQAIAWEQDNRRPTPVLPAIEMDSVAERFGFTSGDELTKKMASEPSAKDTIDGLTEQRLIEEHGELITPQGVQQAANEAIHNEARARFVATELATLQHAMNQKAKAPGAKVATNVLVAAAKQFAQAIVGRRKISDLKPGRYTAAETRAAAAVQKAMAAGDQAAAVAAQRDKLLNLFAARETVSARDELIRAVEYLRKFERDSVRSKLPPEYLDQIDALLEKFDLKAATTQKEIARRKSLASWLASQQDLGIEPNIPQELIDKAGLTSYKDLTVDEMRGLVDTIKQIEHLARLKSKLLTARDQREYAAIRDEIAASINHYAGDRQADTRTPTTNMGRWFQAVKNFGAAHIKAATWARVMDGGKAGGPVWEYFIRPANERGDMETKMRAEAAAALHEIIAPWLKGKPAGGKGVFFPTIGRSMNRESILALALNTGNEGNLQRLLGGENWALQDIKPVLDTLSRSDWEVVQKIWDHFESYRPLIGAKEMRVYGKEPDWIKPAARQFTLSDGTTMSLAGGYYPIKYDPAASVRAEEHADAEGAKRLLKGAYGAATTSRSFTKARVEEVVGRPLLYTLSGLYSGVNDVIHDLAWHEWLIDANRLLKSQTIDSAIREHYGPEAVRQLKSWRDAIAEGDAGSDQAIDAALGRLRQGVSVAGLGFNVMSAMMQPLGMTQSIVRVGAKWIGRGSLQYIANPRQATREVQAQSDFMASRARTQFRELNEILNTVQGQTAAKTVMTQTAYYLMMQCQQMVDVPTWLGAYEKAMSEGNDDERSVALADQAVIDAQGGGMTKDLSAMERGGPAQKLFTVFYSFMNTALNLGVGQAMTAPKTTAGRAKLAADMLMLYSAPAVLGALLKDALTPGDSGDSDDWRKLLRKLIGEQLTFLLGLMVVAREFGEVGKTLLGLSDHPRDYAGPAGVRLVADAGNAAKQIQQGEFDDQLRKAVINLAGDIFGLPAAQVNRTITGFNALKEGKTHNPAALAFGYQEPH